MTAIATTTLRIYNDSDPSATVLETSDGERIARELREIGVRFERWAADAELAPGADQAAVIAAYRSSIDALIAECGYQSVDVVRIERGTPNTEPIRKKFLDEHRHSEDEVRFFVEGRGAFYLHVGDRVYQTICTKGDLISVPAGTKHWFDMGAEPEFTAIRLFINPDGWVANFTGDAIATGFPKLD
ncbi:MAG TPA: cupin domain-containing protein [Candidatus Baltobacteraceae bacterium]|nr:cupin domain-containing protein [Candidatus Baltobacteraceae bacterium]